MPGYPNARPTMEGMSKGFQTLFETAKPDPQDVLDGASGKIAEGHLEAKGQNLRRTYEDLLLSVFLRTRAVVTPLLPQLC